MAKENNERKHFKFGRNLGTILIILGSALLIFMVCLIIERVNANKKIMESVKPFSDTNTASVAADLDPDNVERYDAKDFTYFKLDLQCSEYIDGYDKTVIKKKNKTTSLSDSEKDKVKFKIKIEKTDETDESKLDSSSYVCYMAISLAKNKLGDENYSSTYKKFGSDDNLYSTTYTNFAAITSSYSYPVKIKSWPYTTKISSPDAYVYIRYNALINGRLTAKEFVVKYTYDEYMTKDTTGAIIY